MKNYKASLALCALLLASAIGACTDAIPTSHTENIERKNPIRILTANPYEWVGTQHNLILDAAHPYLDSVCTARSIVTFGMRYDTAVAEAMVHAYHATGIDTTTTFAQQLSHYRATYGRNPFFNTSFASNYSTAVGYLSATTDRDSAYCVRILNFFKAAYANETEPDIVLDSIEVVEAELLAITNWGTDENRALVAVAVAKHSVARCIQHFDELNSRAFSNDHAVGKVAGKRKGIIASTIVGCADVTGAIIGAGVGAAAFGIGAIPGAAVGAAGGSSGALTAVGIADYLGQAFGWWN